MKFRMIVIAVALTAIMLSALFFMDRPGKFEVARLLAVWATVLLILLSLEWRRSRKGTGNSRST